MVVETELWRSKSVWFDVGQQNISSKRVQVHSQPPKPVKTRSYARSIAFDYRGSDVYGGYKNDEHGSPENVRTDKNFVVTFFEDAIKRHSSSDKMERLLSGHAKNKKSVWRVGGVNSGNDGVYQMSTM